MESLKNFNLKVGDEIVFAMRSGDYGEYRFRKGLCTGKVVGIYPFIFHVEYMIGPNKDIKMYRSFRKIDYQLGEVVKRDRE